MPPEKPLDVAEFRSPVVVVNREVARGALGGLEVGLSFTPVWQRRFQALWDFIRGMSQREGLFALESASITETPQGSDLGAGALESVSFVPPVPSLSGELALLFGAVPTPPAAQTIRDTRANRANYPASAYTNIFYVETDSNSDLIYQSDGTDWVYVTGLARGTLAAILAGLATADAGVLYEVTDYAHVLRWNGTAWVWGPGDVGSGLYQLFEDAPTSTGWQLCDGSTVARLNQDATTTNVTVPDLTTPVYLKGGVTSAAVAGASGLTAQTTATNQTASTGVTVDAHNVVERLDVPGAGIFVFDTEAAAGHAVVDPGHNHGQNPHDHGPGTLELLRMQKRLYYRR